MFEQAAAVPQAACLALQGLLDRTTAGPGDSVLLNGAGGGAGTFAIQIAKSLGAVVTGVDSADKLDTMRALWADHVLDYRAYDYTDLGLTYDYILDFECHRPLSHCRRAMKPGGVYAMVGGATPRIFQLMALDP